MKKYQVGICDSDIEYAVNLMDSINMNEFGRINCKAFSSIGAVRDYLAAGDLDLVMVSDTSQCEKSEEGFSFMDVPVWELTDENSEQTGWTELDSCICIYKYGRVSDIYEALVRGLSASESSSIRKGECIAVYSPIGRCGKTRLAKQLAMLDEVRGGIYIGMEDFSDRMESLRSRILYLLKIKSPELAEAIENELISEGAFHSLYVTGTYVDSRIVSSKDIRTLTDSLFDTGRFSTVVYDIGGAAIDGPEVLGAFDKIYMPVLENEISDRKINCFYEQLRSTGHRKLMTRLRTLVLPDAEVGSSEFMSAVWNLYG